MAVYARILRSPRIAVLIAATTLGRLPFAINGLAIVLFLREVTGSFAVAGLTTGMLALGSAIGAPFAGRLVDRRGVRLVLPLAVVHTAALLAIWALGAAGAATVAIAAAALVAGAAFPPTGSVLRSRWPELLDEPELVRGAYAFDSVVIEVSFVAGPLITAAIVALAGPEVALGVAAGLVIAGAALFLFALPGDHGPIAADARPSGILGALSEPAIRMVALTTLPVGFCIGTIEVSVPAFSDAHGSPELAGILLALWSVASGIGGLVFGVRSARRGLVETYVLIALLFPLACLPLAAASSPLAMAALVMLAGAPIAPLIASRNELVGAVARRGTGTESFTWLLTALVAGLSAGAAVAGAVIEAQGWPAAVLVGTIVAALGAAFAFAGRDALRPRAATS
jgi:predicted MFS family arabinose efflux permease